MYHTLPQRQIIVCTIHTTNHLLLSYLRQVVFLGFLFSRIDVSLDEIVGAWDRDLSLYDMGIHEPLLTFTPLQEHQWRTWKQPNSQLTTWRTSWKVRRNVLPTPHESVDKIGKRLFVTISSPLKIFYSNCIEALKALLVARVISLTFQ